jgi:hypothetical protein
MLKVLSEAIVYVNVTLVLGSRHIESIDRGNCLCKCYTSSSKPPC